MMEKIYTVHNFAIDSLFYALPSTQAPGDEELDIFGFLNTGHWWHCPSSVVLTKQSDSSNEEYAVPSCQVPR